MIPTPFYDFLVSIYLLQEHRQSKSMRERHLPEWEFKISMVFKLLIVQSICSSDKKRYVLCSIFLLFYKRDKVFCREILSSGRKNDSKSFYIFQFLCQDFCLWGYYLIRSSFFYRFEFDDLYSFSQSFGVFLYRSRKMLVGICEYIYFYHEVFVENFDIDIKIIKISLFTI